MGERGDKGDEGSCGIDTEGKQDKACREKSLMLLIEKNFRDSLGRELNKTELADIYNFVYSRELPDATNGKINLTLTTYEDLNKFNSILMSEIEIRLEENRTNLESQTNIIKDVLTNMEKYITAGESKITTISRE
jgi:hypothetical protein